MKTDLLDIRNCDCMDLMQKFPDKHFDLAVVDPPYGIGINSSGRLGHYGGKGKKWDDNTPTDEYFAEVFRVSKNQIIWGANYFSMPPCRGFIIWDKEQPEDVSFASCEYAWSSFDKSARTFYLRPQCADIDRIHPTQKPVLLYNWIFANYAKPGMKILDTHMGSGSIAISAHYNKMHLTASELDKDYYNAACERIERETRQLTLF